MGAAGVGGTSVKAAIYTRISEDTEGEEQGVARQEADRLRQLLDRKKDP
jgi:hypothetical protein